MGRTRLLVAVLALGACATTGSRGGVAGSDAETEAKRPDARALAIETRVIARTVRIVLSERWREEAKLEALHRDEPEAGEWRGRGSATLTLRGLRVEASEEIRLIFLSGHEDILLYARQVKRFEQVKGYGHRTEDVDMVTMANDQVSIFQQ